MTGYSDLQSIIDSVNVGEVFRYVNKPWQAEKLKETVRFACNVADQRRSITKGKITVPPSSFTLGIPEIEHRKSEFELLFVDSNESHLQSFKAFLSLSTLAILPVRPKRLCTRCAAFLSLYW